MNRNIINTLVVSVLLLCAAPAAVNAQEYISTPVTVSKEKVRVNGQICYSHIVKEKQTLYSISKAYEVTIDDIYAFNPSVKENGLKKNSIILIPAKAQEAKAQETKAQETKASETKVQEPASQQEQTVSEPEVKVEEKKEDKQRTHTVKWYEDLNMIAEKYGVSAELIMKANNLSSPKIAKRQKLVIPAPDWVPENADDVSEAETVEEEVETLQPSDTTENDNDAEKEWGFFHKNDVKATLILPMKANTDNMSRNNMDFYSGVLLAVKDLAESGISTELNVYDSSDSTHPIASEDIDGSDLIIGPVSYGDLGRLLASGGNPQMIISPLDPRAESLAYTHQNFIQVPTPQSVQYQDLVDWIKEDTVPGDVVLVVSEKGARQTDGIAQMIQAADSSGLAFAKFSYSILEGRDVTEPLTKLMTETGTNRVLIASESEAFVNDVVRNLNILVYNKRNVAVYAPSRIRNFETIEVENLHNTAVHVSLGYLIDYDSQQVKNFLLKYRALYNAEPSQYAFQGYDIATYFISMYSKYGSRWIKKLDEEERQLLQSTFDFIPVEEGGYINNGVRRIVYGNRWSVTQVR